MASSWGDVVSKQADQISDRLRQLVSSGLHFLRDELGVDLGLKPELCAAWVIPTTALICLVLLLVLVAACGGSWRRKHGVARSKSAPAEVVKAPPVKAPKADEPKKKTKKKSAEKAKKSKKKPKPEVKPTQAVSSTDGKEPDEGAWETKISNREKRQQRKKEKGSNDESGSPGSGQHAGQQAEQQPAAPVNTKKNKVLSTWNNVSSVNTGGRTDMSVKHPPQVNPSDRNKSSAAIKTTGHRTSETFAWAQESNAAGVPVSQPSSAELGNGHPIADEWSGFNGVGAVDPSSDWNAPTELWGNYDEPKPEKPAAQETSVSQLQESDDDKDKGDPSGSSKSKRKKKKKKKPEDETAGSQVNIENSSVPAECGSVKPRPHVPVEESTKQILAPQSGQNWVLETQVVSPSEVGPCQLAQILTLAHFSCFKHINFEDKMLPNNVTNRCHDEEIISIIHSLLLINAVVLLILLSALNDPVQYHYHLTSAELGTDLDVMDDANMCIAAAISLLMILICGMAAYGAYKQHAAWIIPFFCYQIFDFALNTLVAISVMVYPNTIQDYLEQLPGTFPYKEDLMSTNNICLVFAVLIFIGCILAFKAYLIACVWNCYRYVSGRGTTEVLVYVTTNDTTVLLPSYEEVVAIPPKKPPPE
ncbi:lysosomal-associated transmembrane protein 4B [Silurus asotus]|uniref:Lysosomal-associated transmembrane protein 4B n=1 Tax=Silurus asotus TaxID=30991 RepID=A0AAD5FHB6_SILAS|nr:lysosomal-associated transmembrane protein 4B [Silurus asotus]